MRIENYFQPPIPMREEEFGSYRLFLEDYGRWHSTMGRLRPFEPTPPYYVQIGYQELFASGGNVCLLPDCFDQGLVRLRAATCATVMIDQDMFQLFRGEDLYGPFRKSFVFPKTDNNAPPIDFVDEAILKDEALVKHMKCLYLLAFRWLNRQTRHGTEFTLRLYSQLRTDNADHDGPRGILWKQIFADVP
jgi:hypothetical protein